jgi:hypothetical protein
MSALRLFARESRDRAGILCRVAAHRVGLGLQSWKSPIYRPLTVVVRSTQET